MGFKPYNTKTQTIFGQLRQLTTVPCAARCIAATRRRPSAAPRPPSEELASSSQLLYHGDSLDELTRSGAAPSGAAPWGPIGSHLPQPPAQRRHHQQPQRPPSGSARPAAYQPLYERLQAAHTQDWSADRLDKWLAEWAARPTLLGAAPSARHSVEPPGASSTQHRASGRWKTTPLGLAVF